MFKGKIVLPAALLGLALALAGVGCQAQDQPASSTPPAKPADQIIATSPVSPTSKTTSPAPAFTPTPTQKVQPKPGTSATAGAPPARTATAVPTAAKPAPLPTVAGKAVVATAGAQGLPPARWREWPVQPVISQRAVEIYKQGLQAGNLPQHFSKVGDCQVIHQYFLGLFDSPGSYQLDFQSNYLANTINYFSGSWGRPSEAVRTGFNVASVLTPLNADPQVCQSGETPLQCEFRLWKPSIVLISMETWAKDRPTQAYSGYLRQIIDFAISKGALPILSTKADNLEGDDSINLAVASLASEYDIPLWNFWRAAHALPDHGLTEDGFHLTNASSFFANPKSMEAAWPWRNLTALQAIDTVWRVVIR